MALVQTHDPHAARGAAHAADGVGHSAHDDALIGDERHLVAVLDHPGVGDLADLGEASCVDREHALRVAVAQAVLR